MDTAASFAGVNHELRTPLPKLHLTLAVLHDVDRDLQISALRSKRVLTKDVRDTGPGVAPDKANLRTSLCAPGNPARTLEGTGITFANQASIGREELTKLP